MKKWTTFFLLMFGQMLLAQTPFQFEGQAVSSGMKKHFTIEIANGEHQTTIPITIFHGKKDGQVLGITAGVHGYEYAPILAGQQLIKKIDPASLTGTVILVQIANMESFLGRSPFTNPMDGVNLNRAFPGKIDGTITERIAHFISHKVIARSDYFVDMHSGDAPEDLMAYSAYYNNDNFPEISKMGRKMAASMGFDYMVVFETTGKNYLKTGTPSTYCSAEAFKQGKPAVDIECGRLGMIEPVFVNKIITGIENLLRQLDMTEDMPIITKPIAFINQRSSQISQHTGFFYPQKTSSDYVIKGMPIGHITDFFGRHLDTIRADKNGIILFMLGTPPVNKGETLVNIGIIK